VESDKLIWKNHPAAYNPKRTMLVALFLILIFVAVYLTTSSWVLTAVAVLIMFGSLTSFFLPTIYSFDNKNIYIKTLSGKRTFNWGRFRSYYPDKNGVLLSPFLRPSRLENFRGIYLRFTNNRKEVLGYIEGMLESQKKEDGDVVS
jgi:hypothetical protein